jgi:hypothetical protein
VSPTPGNGCLSFKLYQEICKVFAGVKVYELLIEAIGIASISWIFTNILEVVP